MPITGGRLPWWRQTVDPALMGPTEAQVREQLQKEVLAAEPVTRGEFQQLQQQFAVVQAKLTDALAALAETQGAESEQLTPPEDINRSDDFTQRLEIMSFHWWWVARNAIKIGAGSLRLHGLADPIAVAASGTITLQWATCWVFLTWPKNTPTSVTIDTIANEPKTEPSTWRWPLLYFEALTPTTYKCVRDCRFDVNLGAPMA